jgi:16S rRNA (uracil1498-N3)-methyltransferase
MDSSANLTPALTRLNPSRRKIQVVLERVVNGRWIEDLVQLQRLVIASSQLHDHQIVLTLEQQHYLGRVLRLQQGDRFIAMDGQGQSWLAQLVGGSSDVQWYATCLEPISVTTELPIAITLIAALPKGTAFDEVVRQATEVGVTSIAPVISDRTLLHPSPQKLERWRRIAQEAAEQSERQIVPTILEPVPLAAILQTMPILTNQAMAHYICVTRQAAPHLLHCLMEWQEMGRPESVAIAIGPEGGWTAAEVGRAIASGYQAVSLGSRILRAVTAPIVALSLIAASCDH